MSEGIIIAVVGVVGAVLAALITRSGNRVEGRLERVERDVEAFGERLDRIGDRFDRLTADLGARMDRLFEAVAGLGPDDAARARLQEISPAQDDLPERVTQAMAEALTDFRKAWRRELKAMRFGSGAQRPGRRFEGAEEWERQQEGVTVSFEDEFEDEDEDEDEDEEPPPGPPTASPTGERPRRGRRPPS